MNPQPPQPNNSELLLLSYQAIQKLVQVLEPYFVEAAAGNAEGQQTVLDSMDVLQNAIQLVTSLLPGIPPVAFADAIKKTNDAIEKLTK